MSPTRARQKNSYSTTLIMTCTNLVDRVKLFFHDDEVNSLQLAGTKKVRVRNTKITNIASLEPVPATHKSATRLKANFCTFDTQFNLSPQSTSLQPMWMTSIIFSLVVQDLLLYQNLFQCYRMSGSLNKCPLLYSEILQLSRRAPQHTNVLSLVYRSFLCLKVREHIPK